MNIGYDAKRAMNNYTGLGNHSRILLHALQREFSTHEYHLYYARAKEDLKNSLVGDYTYHQPQSAIYKALPSLWRSYGISAQLAQDKIDLYHGLSNELPLNIHQFGFKKVVTIHDVLFLKKSKQYPLLDRKIYDYKTRYATKYSSHVIAVSEETKADLMHYYEVPEQKITVIYPSIDNRFYEPALPATIESIKQRYLLPSQYILNVSSFYERKNQINLIRAFDLIKDKIAEDLVLVGNGGDKLNSIIALIAERNLAQRVHIIQNVSNDDLPAVYQAASLFVFPSWYEGFGAPVLEGLFSGIPVLATGTGAITEAAGKDALGLDPHNISDIAEKIRTVLDSKAIQSEMIARGKTHIINTTDRHFAQKTMEVYLSL